MTNTQRDRGLGALALAATAFLWSSAGLLIKLVDWNPFAIACGRSLVAAIFLWVWLRKPHFPFSGPQLGAALGCAATMLLFVYANKATTAANAILLQYGSPIYTALLGAVLLKERPRAEHWLAFVAVAGGMALFFMGDLGGGELLGNLAAAAAGVTFAIYFVCMRMQKDGSPLESSLLAIIITGLEPVFNPLWVFLALGEKPGPNALAGGAIILAAVVGSSIVTTRRARR